MWVGHDWGAPVVWNIASHHPERCHGVAALCVPYRTVELGLDALVALVDRRMYPADEYPYGQWDYQAVYPTGPPTSPRCSTPTRTARQGAVPQGQARGPGPARGHGADQPVGRVVPRGRVAPDLPRDADVVTEADLRSYAAALARNGFCGPDAWYLNHEANAAYAAARGRRRQAADACAVPRRPLRRHLRGGNSRLAEPQRAYVDDLTERILDCGHWMPQERPAEVNAALVAWLRDRLPAVCPAPVRRCRAAAHGGRGFG